MSIVTYWELAFTFRLFRVINVSLDDIEEVIKRAEHMRFEEGYTGILNPISALPTSKEKIKKAIIERINLLVVSYTSLATFVPDETLQKIKKTSRKKVYIDVLNDMEKLKEELWKHLK